MTVSRRLALWGPVAIYMAAIFAASAQSNPSVPGGVPDTVLHFAAFFGLAVLVVRALGGGLPPVVDRAIASLTLLITVGYAVTDEVHQMFVPLRTPEIRDLVADAAGSAAGLFACWAWHIIATSGTQPPTSQSER